MKEQYYLEFIHALSENAVSNHSEQSKDAVAQAQNKILLIGSAEVVSGMRSFLVYSNGSNDDFTVQKHDALLTDLLKSMRKDLYGKKNVNGNYPIVSLSRKGKR